MTQRRKVIAERRALANAAFTAERGPVQYVITRIACRNPQIDDRKLYLTSIGFWTLDIDHARRFDSEADAEVFGDLDTKTGAQQMKRPTNRQQTIAAVWQAVDPSADGVGRDCYELARSALLALPLGTFADETTWQRDPSDTISAHDGVICIVDDTGVRWKRNAI